MTSDSDPDWAQENAEASERIDAQLANLPDGSGCFEIWEYLSETRDEGNDRE